VFGPSTVNFCRFRFAETELSLAFGIRQARPEHHREFHSVAGGKLQEFCQGAGFHVVILARVGLHGNAAICEPPDPFDRL